MIIRPPDSVVSGASSDDGIQEDRAGPDDGAGDHIDSDGSDDGSVSVCLVPPPAPPPLWLLLERAQDAIQAGDLNRHLGEAYASVMTEF